MAKAPTKSRKIIKKAFSEVKEENMSKEQKIAIALSKARKRGAKVPKKRKSKK